jgi:hypothetical protein
VLESKLIYTLRHCTISKLKISLKDSTYYLSGGLFEDALLTEIKPIDGTIKVDLKNLEQVNSIGSRIWIKHLSQFADSQISLANCSNSFLDIASILVQMLGTGGAKNIKSGVLFFECIHCQHEEQICKKLSEVDTEEKRESLIIDCPSCSLSSLKIQDSAFVHILEDNGFN